MRGVGRRYYIPNRDDSWAVLVRCPEMKKKQHDFGVICLAKLSMVAFPTAVILALDWPKI